MTIESLEQHEALIDALMDEACWRGGGTSRQRIDTHISTVILAGDLAYKIKKPLDLGFLDFLSLEKRRLACDEELRLNRRLAPRIYLGVSAVTGSIASPAIDGPGDVIDWAVRMRRFDPDAVLSNPAIALDRALIAGLAHSVGYFHIAAEAAGPASSFGSPDAVAGPMRDNFRQIRELRGDDDSRLGTVQAWTDTALAACDAALIDRRRAGQIKECHGDLHLGNIALIDAVPVVFDAIEFNPALRWIDTVNDVAFLTMDLHHRARAELVYAFLDGYLQVTGDYAGLTLLQLYEVYRAMVRAKIAAIRCAQIDDDASRRPVEAELASYLDLADALCRPRTGAIVITHGVSGSGKSHQAARIVGELPAVRLRSDVERKRLLGIAADADATAHGAYTDDLNDRTYERLGELAAGVAAAGYIAIVDATFLRRRYRARFAELAREHDVPFAILDVDAPLDTLRQRILGRRGSAGNVSDADLQVLELQRRERDPLTAAERAVGVPVTPQTPLDIDRLRELLRR
ncbi:MAG: AAA family ATPase [Gammaproteobacteria bacterium]|nr:AAA family ATPase [Gammaproteobacteria bacterium]